MNSELKSELLHLIETGRGSSTKELWLEIVALRMNKRWPFKEPDDQPALQLMLLGLSAEGQIENVPGRSWMLTSQVPRDTRRRTFEEETQRSLFA